MADIQRYSQIADPAVVQQINEVVSSLVQAGWTTTEGREPTAAHRFVCAKIAVQYGLDPLLRELYLLGGVPYVSLAGLRRVASRSGCLDGVETRPATREEREAAQVEDGEHYWIAHVYRTDRGRPTIGHGFAHTRNVGIGKGDPRILRNMAENRALARALRAAFDVSIPTDDEMHAPEVQIIQSTPAETPSAPAAPPPTTVRGRTSQLPAPTPAPAPVVEVQTRQPELIPVAAPAQPVELDADGAYHEIGQAIERLFNEDDPRREQAVERAAVLEPDAVIALYRAVKNAPNPNAARQLLVRGAP